MQMHVCLNLALSRWVGGWDYLGICTLKACKCFLFYVLICWVVTACNFVHETLSNANMVSREPERGCRAE